MLHNSVKQNTRLARTILGVLLLTVLLGVTPALADNLDELRTSGAIGESVTGYVVARDPAAQGVANNINIKRRAVYTEKAASQGVSVDQVGRVYAAEILKQVPAGTWVQNDNGAWTQK